MSRRQFAGLVATLLGGAVAGCSPMRAILKSYPDRYDERSVAESYLRAFVLTVIPGAPADDPHLTRIYFDDFYPFHEHVGFFTSELASGSEELTGNDRFDLLPIDQRRQVIARSLRADAVVARLFRAAIFAAQVSFYGSIYDDSAGCRLIDFDGPNEGFPPEVMYYPDPLPRLAHEMTKTGNYH